MSAFLLASLFLGPAALRVEGPSGCPDGETVYRWIEGYLGRPPFEAASREVVLRLRPVAGGVSAEIRYAAGGRRLLEAVDCEAAGRAAAFSIAVALDPLGVKADAPRRPPPPRPAPPPPSAPPPATSPPPPSAPPPATSPPPAAASPASAAAPVSEAPVGFGLRGSLVGAAGHRPSPGLGLRIGGELGWGAWRVGLGALWLPATRSSFGAGEVRADLLAAELRGCLGWRRWRACALGLAGRQRGEGRGFSVDKVHDALHVGVGAELGAGWALGGVELHLGVEGLFLPVISRLRVGGATAWRGSPVAAGLSLGVSWPEEIR